jgi:gamma-glutamylcysteine synthetase
MNIDIGLLESVVIAVSCAVIIIETLILFKLKQHSRELKSNAERNKKNINLQTVIIEKSIHEIEERTKRSKKSIDDMRKELFEKFDSHLKSLDEHTVKLDEHINELETNTKKLEKSVERIYKRVCREGISENSGVIP